MLVLTNARLIDGRRPPVVVGASVTIADGRIAEVLDGRRSPATGGARVIDLEGAYLLPGLWDVHVHLEWPRLPAASEAELTIQYSANAARALTEAGVTAIRTAGTPHYIDVALERAFETGDLPGPRIFAGGWFLTTTAGHALGTGFARRCDGAAGFVQAIREQVEHGGPRDQPRGREGSPAAPPGQATTAPEKRWVEQRALPPDVVRRAEAAAPEHREWFQRARRAGVRMALGSDLRPLADAPLLELGLWVKDGATPWEALVAATRDGAELCGVGDEVGTVEAGKRADLIAVRDNPLEDIDNLRALALVIKAGRIVADHRRHGAPR
jgi:imidazolonepropionase-like amidohydrolase